MIIIHGTKKLLDKLKVKPEHVLPASQGRLGPWYADVRIIERQHLVLMMNEATMLMVVIPWTEFKASPTDALKAALKQILEFLHVPAALIEEELAAITGVTYAKTASRVILGRMSAAAGLVEGGVEHKASLQEINERLSSYPYTPGKTDPERHGLFADRRTLTLFGVDHSMLDRLSTSPVVGKTMAEMPQRIKPEPRRTHLVDTLILRIELDGIRPEIWRTIMVPVNITLRRLHDVIQAAMGWDDCHLHTFKINGRDYGDRTVFLDDLGPIPMKEERSVTLKSLGLAPLDTYEYEYDMGDSWTHTISVVGTDRVEPGMEIQIIDGDNACPPEDVGGVHGYAWFVHSMMDPQHEDHDQVMEWYGRRFDHTMYDLRAAQRILSVIVLSGAGYPWRKK